MNIDKYCRREDIRIKKGVLILLHDIIYNKFLFRKNDEYYFQNIFTTGKILVTNMPKRHINE